MEKQIEERIFQAYGDLFFRRVLQGLFPVYLDSLVDARMKHDDHFVPHIAGYSRWGLANKLIKMVGEGFEHISSEYIYSSGGSSPHTELRANGVIMTCASTKSFEEIPDKAEYRVDLCKKINQLDLFRKMRNEAIVLPDDIYCLLVHGAKPGKRNNPDWVKLIVPDKTMKGLLYECDLIHKYWDYVKHLVVQENTESEVTPVLMPKRKRTAEEEE